MRSAVAGGYAGLTRGESPQAAVETKSTDIDNEVDPLTACFREWSSMYGPAPNRPLASMSATAAADGWWNARPTGSDVGTSEKR